MSAQPARFSVPARLTESVRATGSPADLAWLAGLPRALPARLADRGLVAERLAEPGGRGSLVVFAHRADDLAPVALKLTRPSAGAAEAAALRVWAGRGAVLLLDGSDEGAGPDAAGGALLLERLHGEIPLRSLAEAKAMLEATSLLRRLWVPAPPGHPFESLADRAAATASRLAERRSLPAAADAAPLVDEALEALALAGDGGDWLLHGDFQHGRALAADRSPWLAVAPRPLVGDRAYDLARLVLDRLDTLAASPGPRGAARRRLARLAEAVELPAERVRAWTLLRAVDAALGAFAAGDAGRAELRLEFASWL
ncbi:MULTISPECIES: aminoglycoside phosphotransferase family protein [Kitasatospora]|uniref:Putative phosphotransferase n=1 Tax=Kitasatospora setae (strain ATCC 33774 / DSM 43861 / JCM 3304 / KCC A-0304 / NBRC 14216 / KM-6054) TaxID=452652 RepID=E4NHU8_KITSK|nr:MULTISPECIES: aminoglycoside phosphotransferase family protein [Kitasatospora]BAJ31078.1 putative phosphotransferase [Kitasatospora setae KM-6054]